MIKEPMDLSTIEANLRSNQYISSTQFHADVNKIIRNSLLFNATNYEFLKITHDFEDYYRKVMADQSNEPIGRSYSQNYESNIGQDSYKDKMIQ